MISEHITTTIAKDGQYNIGSVPTALSHQIIIDTNHATSGAITLSAVINTVAIQQETLNITSNQHIVVTYNGAIDYFLCDMSSLAGQINVFYTGSTTNMNYPPIISGDNVIIIPPIESITLNLTRDHIFINETIQISVNVAPATAVQEHSLSASGGILVGSEYQGTELGTHHINVVSAHNENMGDSKPIYVGLMHSHFDDNIAWEPTAGTNVSIAGVYGKGTSSAFVSDWWSFFGVDDTQKYILDNAEKIECRIRYGDRRGDPGTRTRRHWTEWFMLADAFNTALKISDFSHYYELTFTYEDNALIKISAIHGDTNKRFGENTYCAVFGVEFKEIL